MDGLTGEKDPSQSEDFNTPFSVIESVYKKNQQECRRTE